ncbi:hypothetical protein ACP4OV_008421 [Aristida adscensionis]
MAIISTVTNDGGAVDPPATAAGAGHAAYQQPASYHEPFFFGHPLPGTAPGSSLPPFPSTATASWASDSVCRPPAPPHRHHQPWQPPPSPQHGAQTLSSSFLEDTDLLSGGGQSLFDVINSSFSPLSPTPTFAPPATPPQPQMPQPAMAAAVVVEAVVPLAAVPTGVPGGLRILQKAPKKPAPRPRGRPRKPAEESGEVRPPKKAKSGELRPPTKKKAKQHQPQEPSISISSDPCAWEEEAAAMEAAIGSYMDPRIPGVRFRPTDQEIIVFLRMKYLGRRIPVDFIKSFNVYQAHPETVQDTCGGSVDGCWYVFSSRNRRYPNGVRPARTVGDVGFWKSNTKEAEVRGGRGEVMGKVTALTFELGHQPDGMQTAWKMKEYCIPEKQHPCDGERMLLDDWVLCKLFCNGHGDDQDTIENAEAQGDEGELAVHIGQTPNNSKQDLSVEDYWIDQTAPPF